MYVLVAQFVCRSYELLLLPYTTVVDCPPAQGEKSHSMTVWPKIILSCSEPWLEARVSYLLVPPAPPPPTSPPPPQPPPQPSF